MSALLSPLPEDHTKLVASFLNQPVEVEEFRREVAELAGGGTPQLVLRMGFGSVVPPTRRRPVAEILS